MGNEGDVLVSKTDRPADTMFHHLWKPDVLHAFLIGGIENARPQTCFFPWICLLRDFLVGRLNCHPKPHQLGPILSNVSSTINSSTLFILEDNFFGLYFCIQFQMETWFRLIKHDDSLSEALLKESPEK